MIIWTSPSLDRPHGKQLSVTWDALARRCREPKSAESKGRLSRWAPVEFRHGYRCRANVLRAYAVTLDVDDGVPSDPILRAIDGLRYIVHSTFSATREASRWRVVVAIDRVVDGEEYGRLWRWLASALEAEGAAADYAACDPSRAWAVPAIPPSGWYCCVVGEGRPVAVADGLAAIPREEPPAAPSRTRDDSYDARVRRARLYVERMDPAIQGSGGSTQTLKVAIAIVRGFSLEPDDALAILVQDYNPRCQPEWSLWELKHKVRQAVQRSRQPYGYLLER